MLPFLGIGWQITTISGWGVFGLNLARELMRRGEPEPLMLYQPGTIEVDSVEDTQMLDHMVARFTEVNDMRTAMPEGQKMTLKGALVLHSLGNRFVFANLAEDIRGRINAGMIFFEDTQIDDLAKRRATYFGRILAGSTWNAEILRAAGIEDVRVALQGVDLTRFKPRETTNLYTDRFVVFSGGKMEFRKGQDIVLAAFKIFHEAHPDTLLVTAWQSPWPQTAQTITVGGIIDNAPKIRESGGLAVAEWAVENGLPEGRVIDLGEVPNHAMARVFAEVNVAVFPNRCEGGTNLVAMEAMASGVPVILSDNTGHLDLTKSGAAHILADQSPITYITDAGTEGWGDSKVEEVVAALEKAYTDSADAKRRSALGTMFMKDWSWQQQVAKLLAEIEDLE